METIRIVTDVSKHAGCGGFLGMSQEAPQYIVEHEGLETRIAGVEMVCLRCGERIRSQDQVEEADKGISSSATSGNTTVSAMKSWINSMRPSACSTSAERLSTQSPQL